MSENDRSVGPLPDVVFCFEAIAAGRDRERERRRIQFGVVAWIDPAPFQGECTYLEVVDVVIAPAFFVDEAGPQFLVQPTNARTELHNVLAVVANVEREPERLGSRVSSSWGDPGNAEAQSGLVRPAPSDSLRGVIDRRARLVVLVRDLDPCVLEALPGNVFQGLDRVFDQFGIGSVRVLLEPN